MECWGGFDEGCLSWLLMDGWCLAGLFVGLGFSKKEEDGCEG